MIVTGIPLLDFIFNSLLTALRWSVGFLVISLFIAAVVLCFADLGGSYGDDRS